MSARFFIVLFLTTYLSGFSQSTSSFVLQGKVRDARTKATLSGTNLIFSTPIPKVVVTSSTGDYFILLPAGKHFLEISMVGYEKDTLTVNIKKGMSLDFYLKPSEKAMDTVLIATQKRLDNLKKDLIGVQRISVSDFKNLPVLFGEKDIFKSIQLLPGIKTAGEGSSGFYVRGGSSDQNLILLDGATVNNASHLLGFFSVFNSDIINNFAIYKGSIPSEFGGRLSSVIDIHTQEEGLEKFTMKGGLGLITSRISLQGPIVKKKIAFLVSGRKAYPDAYVKYSPDTLVRHNKLNFRDFNAKLNIVLNKRNDLSISAYKGEDYFGLGTYFGIAYGNELISMKWRRVNNSQLNSTTTFSYTNFGYDIKIKNSNSDLMILSSIRNASLKHEYQFTKNQNNVFKFGIDVTLHEIKPSSIIASSGSGYNSVEIDPKRNFEGNVFFNHSHQFNKRATMNYGVRINSFSIFGPGNYINYDSLGNPTKYVSYRLFQVGIPYVTLEPRVSLNVEIARHQYLKFAYTRNAQNIHQISNSTSANPTDMFMSSNNNIKPEIADQISVGYFKNINESIYEFSAEAYYKSLYRQIDFRNGSQLVANELIERQLIYGVGRAYGLELQFKRKKGPLTGWIAYTLSKTERKFSSVNRGNWFNARQDRPHEISLVGIYQLNKRWTFSSIWVYYSGSPVTFPAGKYYVAGQNAYYYTERNGNRMPAYHRLDLSITLYGKPKPRYESSWSFAVYNAYNRENAYSINFKDDPLNANKTIAVQTTLFKLVPSIVYNFKY